LKLKKFVPILAFLSSTLGWASAASEFKLQGHSIKLTLPEEWITRTDLLGLPLAILSPPQADKNRVVLTLAQASKGEEKMVLGESFIDSSQIEYESNKNKWLKEHQGFLIDFVPKEILQWNGHKVLALGVSFQMKGKKNLEKSYYIECGERLYFGKILVNAENEKLLPLAQKTLESLQCL
jgi:hypothetical protein